jgi:hypothetical protein
MSYKNPNVTDVINNSTCYRTMTSYLGRNYLNLAKAQFGRTYERKACIEDSEDLMRIFALQWYDYYINNPKRERLYRAYSKPLWEYIKPLHVSVADSTREFVRQYNPEFIGVWNYHYDVYILKNNLFEEYKKYVNSNKKKFPYRRLKYVDYSHLAYNGVSNDF